MQVYVVTEVFSGRVVGTALFHDVALNMCEHHEADSGNACDITSTIVGVMR